MNKLPKDYIVEWIGDIIPKDWRELTKIESLEFRCRYFPSSQDPRVLIQIDSTKEKYCLSKLLIKN